MGPLLSVHVSVITVLAALLQRVGFATHSAVVKLVLERAEKIKELPQLIQLSSEQKPLKGHIALDAHLRFHNFCWSLCFDLFLGFSLGFLILRNSSFLSDYFNDLLMSSYVVHFETYIDWLMGYPAGFKLNGNLTRFLGQMHMWLLSLWRTPLTNLPIEVIIWTLGVMSMIGGASLVTSATVDLISVILIPLHVSYKIAARLFNLELSIMASLFRLFRGKKWNVLRARLDSADYDLDQLLLGTILFSVLVFVFPTIAAYYSLFLFSVLIRTVLIIALDGLTWTITDLPLYALFNRHSLIGGIVLQVTAAKARISYRTKPISCVLKPFLSQLLAPLRKFLSLNTLSRSVNGLPVSVSYA